MNVVYGGRVLVGNEKHLRRNKFPSGGIFVAGVLGSTRHSTAGILYISISVVAHCIAFRLVVMADWTTKISQAEGLRSLCNR